jgi:hypothetical protein
MRSPLRALRPRLTYANVAATLALILAMGGTAYATASIGSPEIIDNSIRSVDIRDETLTAADIRSGAVGTSELADGGVRRVDLADGAVGSAKVADGAIGYAKLGASARSVAVQTFDAQFSYVEDLMLADNGSLEVWAHCAQTPTIYSPGGSTVGTFDGSYIRYFTGEISFTPAQLAPFVVTSADEQRALMVFASITFDGTGFCRVEGFAIALR